MSASTSGERSSDPLPLQQALVSVSTSVLRQGPVLQEPAPVGRGGHEDASSLKMHRPLSSPVRLSRPLSSPMLGLHPPSSPIDGHSLRELPVRQRLPSGSPGDGHCPLPMPMIAHRPSVMPIDARLPSINGQDDLVMEIEDHEHLPADNVASEH